MDFKYPYTDFHELNLDWFLAEFKKLTAEWLQVQHDWEDEQQAFQDLHDYVENYFANLDLYQEVHDILWSPEMQGNIQIILSNLTTNMLPSVVADQITAVVASQLSTVVALQLPAVVEAKLPAALPAAVAGEASIWLENHVDPATGYVIDDTLSISMAAADAKATGDRIADVQTEVDNINSVLNIRYPLTKSDITTNSSTDQKVIDLDIHKGITYTINVDLAAASDVDTYISIWDGVSATYTAVYTLTAGATTKTITWFANIDGPLGYIAFNTGRRVLKYDISVANDYTNINSVDRLDSDIEDLSKITTSVDNSTWRTVDITDDCTFTNGSVTKINQHTTASGYRYTSYIRVNEGDIIFTEGNTPFRIIAAYSHGYVDEAKGKENIWTYTVPSGIDSIIITIYDGQNEHWRTIKKKCLGYKEGIEQNPSFTALKNHSHTYAKRHPMITFIDDDGNSEFYTVLLPIMRTYGIPMVSAYMGDSNPDMQSNNAMMTKEQCLEVVKEGGEIIVHYNPDLTSLTLDEAEKVLLESKEVLERNGFRSRLVAYSNGTSNAEIRDMVSKYFDGAFTGAYPRVANDDRSNHGCIVQYAIHREPCGGLYYDSDPASRSLAYFQAMIDEAIAANGWLVFTLHSWLMPPGHTQPEYGNTDQIQLLKDIIEYIQTLQGGGSDVEIVTASKGFETFGNAFQCGDFMGHWNDEIFASKAMLGDHSIPGIAFNKEGKAQFPSN